MLLATLMRMSQVISAQMVFVEAGHVAVPGVVHVEVQVAKIDQEVLLVVPPRSRAATVGALAPGIPIA